MFGYARELVFGVWLSFIICAGGRRVVVLLFETPLSLLFASLPLRLFDAVGVWMESLLRELVEMLIDDFIGTVEGQADEWSRHASENRIRFPMLQGGLEVCVPAVVVA